MDQDVRRRLMAVRSLSRAFPPHSAEERLALIGDIASGKADPDAARVKPSTGSLVASIRAVRGEGEEVTDVIEEEVPPKKKRERKVESKGKNREETGGQDRAEGSE